MGAESTKSHTEKGVGGGGGGAGGGGEGQDRMTGNAGTEVK